MPTKQAIDYNILLRAGLGGAAAGTGLMSAVTLLRMINAQKRDAKDSRGATETDKDTIVLTLPKTAESYTVEKPVSRSWSSLLKKMQTRRMDGTIGAKVAATGWPTQTGAALAFLGGGVGGAALVDKIYAIHREMKLRRELEAAKREYLDLLAGGEPKTAAAVELFNALTPIGLDKAAEDRAGPAFGALNYLLSVPALLSILGAGSTAYLTKKILDEKLKETESEGYEPPRINRIVLKSASGCEDLSRDEAKAAIVLAVQCHAGDPGPLSDDDVKIACARAGMTPKILMRKVAEDGIADVVSYLKANHPQLLSSLQTKFTQAGTGPLAWLSRRFPGTFQNALQLPGIRGLAGGATEKALTRVLDPRIKVAKVQGGVGPMLAAALGGNLMEPSTEDIAKAVIEEQERAKDRPKPTLQKGKIRVEGADEAAAEYLANNREQVVNLIRELARSGQL